MGLVTGGSGSSNSQTLIDSAGLNMIDILEFGNSIGIQKSDTDNSALFQAAVNTGKNIYVPAGIWNITNPVTYTNRLLLFGECGFNTNSGAWTQIVGGSGLDYRPVFHRAGHYMHYSGNGNAPHQWVSTSGSAASVAKDAIVQIERIDFRSLSPNNSMVQIFGYKQAYVKYCQVAPLFRGIEFIRGDGSQVVQCAYSAVANPSWVSDIAKLKNSYAFMTDGNTMFEQCNCQGGLVGPVLHGNNCYVSGGRFEILHYAGIWGGKSPDPSTLNQSVTPAASVMSTATFESNRRLDLELGSGSEFRNFNIIGINCFNDSGVGDGQLPRYGIKLISKAASASISNGAIGPCVVSQMVDGNESPITSGFPLVSGVGEPP